MATTRKTSSSFILEFTVIEPRNEYEAVNEKYVYKESDLFEPGYYIGKELKIKKSLFFLIMRPQHYKVTKLAQNNDIINLV
jgi:hypothetical protein